ncbi:hypothetical protein C8Q75DRAFT_543256 [Abortiporus biennis]|nr:hypothetical protein C8Q75DRAFT_543256 [Abortiporus biennis]
MSLNRCTISRARSYIERSGTAPISITISTDWIYGGDDEEGENQAILEFVELIRDYTERIFKLNDNLNETLLGTFCLKLPLNFPSVQYLTLTNHSSAGEDPPIIPFLRQEYPQLRKLVLTCLIPFSIPGFNNFPNLQELSLNQENGSTLYPDLKVFLDLLEGISSRLVALQLIRVGPLKPISLLSEDRVVEMQTLKKFTIKNEAGRVVGLLNHLILPATCALSILGDKLHDTSSHGLWEVLPRNPRALASLQQVEELCAKVNSFDCCTTLTGKSPSFSITLSWQDDIPQEDLRPLLFNAIVDIPTMFSDALLTILDLGFDFAQCSKQWLKTILDKYPTLEVLQLKNIFVQSRPATISPVMIVLCYDHTVRGLPIHPICPRLDILEFVNFIIDVDWFNEVQRCLLSRKPKKLGRFTFLGCHGARYDENIDWNEQGMTDLVGEYMLKQHDLNFG